RTDTLPTARTDRRPRRPRRTHDHHRPRLELRDAAEVRVLGAERVRRPRRLHDRAAHRLAAAYNSRLAKIAEDSGFEYALTQTRYAASYGADKQHEASAFSLALLGATERLRVIAAFHPGMWHPGVLAKWLITADHLSGGRAAVNIVSAWLKDEFVKFGLPWLEHDERYARTEEFISALRGLLTENGYSQDGDYYAIDAFTLSPKPVEVPGRPHPEIFFGGNSSAAQAAAGRVADWYFSNG